MRNHRYITALSFYAGLCAAFFGGRFTGLRACPPALSESDAPAKHRSFLETRTA